MRSISKHLMITLCFFGAHISNAQVSPLLADSSKQVAIEGSAGLFSNGLPLAFSNKFVYGGEITTDIKDNAANKLKGNNYLAIEAGGKLSFLSNTKTMFGIKNAFWGVEVGTQVLSYSHYSDDLFNLVFYGNEPYEGSSLDLAESGTKSVWFHHVGITGGVVLNNIGSFDKLHLSATPSFVTGILQQDFDLSKGDFLTESDGEAIQIDFLGNYTASDSLSDAFSPKGYGAKIDLSFLLESKKNKIGLTIADLGVIAWTNKLNYNLDTTFTFSGIEIEDIFSVQDTLITAAEIQDSTFTNTPNKTTVMLPMLASVYFEHAFSEQLVLKNWLKYRLVSNYIPFVMSQINYNVAGFTGGLSAAYGGYTGFQAGLHLGYDLGIIDIDLGTTNLLGYIDQKNQFTQNIYGRIIGKF